VALREFAGDDGGVSVSAGSGIGGDGGVPPPFISEDRKIGGHVLRCGAGPERLRVEKMGSMRLELPPGVELPRRGERPSGKDLRRIEGR